MLDFLASNVGEIEILLSEERELERQIAPLEESIKRSQDEERSLQNQAADLRKQWVGCSKFKFCFEYTYYLVYRLFSYAYVWG